MRGCELRQVMSPPPPLGAPLFACPLRPHRSQGYHGTGTPTESGTGRHKSDLGCAALPFISDGLLCGRLLFSALRDKDPEFRVYKCRDEKMNPDVNNVPATFSPAWILHFWFLGGGQSLDPVQNVKSYIFLKTC